MNLRVESPASGLTAAASPNHLPCLSYAPAGLRMSACVRDVCGVIRLGIAEDRVFVRAVHRHVSANRGHEPARQAACRGDFEAS